MTLLEQFLLYNLLPALAAGALSWLFIHLALRALKIEHGSLRLSLLYVPLVKSLLILTGFGLVFRWPPEVFGGWQAQAVPFGLVVPFLLIWLGLALGLRQFLIRRARRLALESSRPALEAAPRLVASMARVAAAYGECRGKMVGSGLICCLNSAVFRPQLLVSGRVRSPLALTGSEGPAVVFPQDLVDRLSDDELDGALAHEYAHFLLSNPAWCSSNGIEYITPLSPVARFLAGQLEREEEKACDDMAVTALGRPEAYAEMLLKSYRFAAERANPLAGRLRAVRQLLGFRPMISERVERLLRPDSPQENLRWQFLRGCALWLGVWLLFGIQ